MVRDGPGVKGPGAARNLEALRLALEEQRVSGTICLYHLGVLLINEFKLTDNADLYLLFSAG